VSAPDDDVTGDPETDLGPLSPLVGVWVGEEGNDVAPSPTGTVAETAYRERMVVEAIGRIDNHEQVLHGVSFHRTAWRLPLEEQFLEEMGYWLWESATGRVMVALVSPRGLSLLAGGSAEAGATKLDVTAELGSPIYGISSNPFLDGELRTVRYELCVDLSTAGLMSYRSIAYLELDGQEDIFRHTNENALTRVHRP
jgi:hypothetical protein